MKLYLRQVITRDPQAAEQKVLSMFRITVMDSSESVAGMLTSMPDHLT